MSSIESCLDCPDELREPFGVCLKILKALPDGKRLAVGITLPVKLQLFIHIEVGRDFLQLFQHVLCCKAVFVVALRQSMK